VTSVGMRGREGAADGEPKEARRIVYDGEVGHGDDVPD
jgi:hypothetical protein